MNRQAAPLTPSRAAGAGASKQQSLPTATPKPSPTPTNVPPPRRPGTDDVALTELRNAGATYDHLRKKGDPVQFWETLRLARSRRAIIAPPEGEAPAPLPEVEASIVHELDLIRRQSAPLVRDLRRFLKKVPGLPEPADRLEMALAFLLASLREHQAVARWLAEPAKHEGKAAEKIRSLAAITDPYREALLPWTLQPPVIEEKSPEPAGGNPSEPGQPAAPSSGRPLALPIDSVNLECLRRALECREILSGMHLESELWETLLLVMQEPDPTRAALQKLVTQLEEGLLEEAQGGAELLFRRVVDLRRQYADWVRTLRTYLSNGQLLPDDLRAFDLAVGFLLPSPGVRDRITPWLEEPVTWQEEVAGLMGPWLRRAEEYLATLKAEASQEPS
jgi:hypothetical protein